MKAKLLIIFSFLILLSSPLFSQTKENDDYINFSSGGSVLSFKKTAPDGSWIEIQDKNPGTSPYYFYLTIQCSDGEIVEGFILSRGSYTKEEIYRKYAEKAKSFNTAINYLPIVGYDDKNVPVCIQPDGMIVYYSSSHIGLIIESVSLPITDTGDFIRCDVNTESLLTPRYITKDVLSEDVLGSVIRFRKTYENCVADFSLSYNKLEGTIKYDDGSSYSGTIKNDGKLLESSYWLKNPSLSDLNYLDGILTTKDKQFKVYEDGEYSEFETLRRKESLAKQEVEAREREAAVKKATAELNKKYGEKYVTAMLNGQLILGTPEELFLLGVSINAYRTITSIDRFYTNGQTSRYDIYGWRSNPRDGVMFSNSAYLGIITFTNGVLTSSFDL